MSVQASWAQEVLRLAERMRPGTVLDPRCVVHRAYAFSEPLDLELLGAALTAVVARHDALRTVPLDGAARLVVRPPEPVAVEVRPLEDPLRSAIRFAAHAPHDLADGPLVRLVWLAGDRGGVLVVSVQHWAADAAALDVLQRDLAACCDALLTGAPLPPAPPSWAEHTARERAASSAPDPAVVEWWRRELAGARRGALPESGGRTGETALVSAELAPETSAALRALSTRHRASPYMVLLAALAPQLEDGRGGDERDLLVFGTDPGRDRATRDLVGFLTEPLPLRLRVALDAPFGDAVAAARAAVLGALAHRSVPFVRLLEAAPRLAVPLMTGRRPATLVQAVAVPPLRLAGAAGTPLPTFAAADAGERSPSALPLDLDLTVEQVGRGHSAGVLHDPGRWTTGDMQQVLARLEGALQSAAADPDLPLRAVA